ncbi:hypothetical protein DFH11DRAFT_1635609 [Phellopilus nigrolimitatus]|nr:hypothetical protein DFH11DRAFT_1635609 [Phellopilus nigrolimitatus]
MFCCFRASALTTCQALIADFASDVFSRLLVGSLGQNLKTLNMGRYCFLHVFVKKEMFPRNRFQAPTSFLSSTHLPA